MLKNVKEGILGRFGGRRDSQERGGSREGSPSEDGDEEEGGLEMKRSKR